MSVAVASRMTAILSPPDTATYSRALAGSIALVVVVAVGLAPTAKNNGPELMFDRRTIVQSAATAFDWTLEAVTVITWLVLMRPNVVT